MQTLTTIDGYEKTPSGAHKITLMGGTVAGTFDDEIGALAERLAGEAEANPVGVTLEKKGDKVFIQAMEEILPPEELGGPTEATAETAPQAEAPAAEQTIPGFPVEAKDAEQVAGDEAHSPGADSLQAANKRYEEAKRTDADSFHDPNVSSLLADVETHVARAWAIMHDANARLEATPLRLDGFEEFAHEIGKALEILRSGS